MTVAQVRVAIAGLLQSPPLDPRSIADNITRQLRRNEQARRARWRKRGLRAPRKKIVA
jgi:ABC-type phosphate transport system ATPase subunit